MLARSIRTLALATFVVCSLAVARSASPEDEVRATFDRFVAAQNAHDLEAVGNLLLDSPQFLWITRGAPVWGRAEALDRFKALYAGTWHLEPESAAFRVVLARPDVAQLYVPIVFTIGPAGQPAPPPVRFLMNQVLVKVGGSWKVASILPVPVPPPAKP